MAALRKAWVENNTAKMRARNAQRRAAQRNATVPWADQNRITQLYADAQTLTKELGVRFEVDHIVPLQNKLVCGLHWEGNLQIIPANDNRKKSNKFEV